MTVKRRNPISLLAASLALAVFLLPCNAQEPLPQAPQPQNSTSQPASSPAAQTQKSQHQTAAEQLKVQEKQRVLGVVPNFSTSYISNAASLSAGQKMQLAFRSAIDPFTFTAAFLAAGVNEGLDNDSGFGWGAEGYFKRSGAAYLDAVDGNILSSGVLPALFHQDPRYFRMGHGSTRRRLLYAMACTVIAKHDNTHRWEPNYSNIGGNIAAGAISNLYYPAADSGWSQTIGNGLVVTAEGAIGDVFDEFWPDISRKLFHKDPTHGLDAKAAAADKAARQALQREE